MAEQPVPYHLPFTLPKGERENIAEENFPQNVKFCTFKCCSHLEDEVEAFQSPQLHQHAPGFATATPGWGDTAEHSTHSSVVI